MRFAALWFSDFKKTFEVWCRFYQTGEWKFGMGADWEGLIIVKVVRNKKSKFFSHRYLTEFYERNRMSHVPHLYTIVILLK